jgi:hypothetical protein
LTGDPPPLDLTRPRTLGVLLTDSIRLYFQNFAKLLAIAAAVVVPAELIVSGVGLGRLSGRASDAGPVAAQLISLGVQLLVTTPLVVAMTIYFLLDLRDGRQPGLRRAIQSGLDVFAALFVPVLVAVACEALIAAVLVLPLALAVSTQFLVLMLVPLALAVRWYFTAQSVVVRNERGLGALRASWELTRGDGWRVAGIVLLGSLLFGAAAGIAGSPLAGAAKSADSGPLALAATIVVETLAAPALALLSTLLYFDVNARKRART